MFFSLTFDMLKETNQALISSAKRQHLRILLFYIHTCKSTYIPSAGVCTKKVQYEKELSLTFTADSHIPPLTSLVLFTQPKMHKDLCTQKFYTFSLFCFFSNLNKKKKERKNGGVKRKVNSNKGLQFYKK